MPTLTACGIDPGRTGGIALFSCTLSPGHKPRPGDIEPLAVWRMPELDGTPWPADIVAAIQAADLVVIEMQQAMPGQGVTGMVSLGRAEGIVLGILACSPFEPILLRPRPSAWKKRMGLTSDKDLSVKIVGGLWPSLAPRLVGPRGGKLDGLAEACALAFYGISQHCLPN